MASLGEEEEEAFEHTLLMVREVSVYKIPPRTTSGGYKCGEWLQSDKIWSGRLRVVSCGDRCEIRLEDPGSGDLFAACFVLPGQRESSVETVLDSSRYFVLRIEDGRGKHAFVGLGFNERNEAFDFNVALSDHEKYVKREHEKETGGEEGDDSQIDVHPAVNRRLKEGETIRINVKNKPSTGSGMLSSAGLSGGATAKPNTNMLLAPPPGAAGKLRSPLPPPPNDPAAARMNSGHNAGIRVPKEPAKRNNDPFSDLSAMQQSLPSSTQSGQTKSTGAGWAAEETTPGLPILRAMSSPAQRPPASSAQPTATSPPPTTATQPLPRAFLATSSPRRAAAATPTPPLFTGRPLNPNPSHASAAYGILYPVATSSATAAGNHRRAPPVGVGFPRAHAVAVPVAPPQQPLVPTQPRSFAAVPRAVVAGVALRPEQPPRGVPIAPQAQPKVNPVPAVTPSPQEQSNSKDKETSKEDSTTVVINDRKVNLLDSESGSLYALCRSWVRNGVPHESQPSFGNGGPRLPKPLPASVVDSRISEKDNDVENVDSEEEKNDTGEYTASDLLKQHVDRAKKIRAGLQRERLRRIERYKQRLALLLPPPSELGKHDGLP